jgi:hypothetical protein
VLQWRSAVRAAGTGPCVKRRSIPLPAAARKLLYASEQDTARLQQARAGYRELIAPLNTRRLKFIDESGVNLVMPRLYGRAPKGERVIDAVPQNYGRNMTIITEETSMGEKLQQGDRFPSLTLKLVQGGTIRLPDEMPTRYAAVLFYRGHW